MFQEKVAYSVILLLHYSIFCLLQTPTCMVSWTPSSSLFIMNCCCSYTTCYLPKCGNLSISFIIPMKKPLSSSSFKRFSFRRIRLRDACLWWLVLGKIVTSSFMFCIPYWENNAIVLWMSRNIAMWLFSKLHILCKNTFSVKKYGQVK